MMWFYRMEFQNPREKYFVFFRGVSRLKWSPLGVMIVTFGDLECQEISAVRVLHTNHHAYIGMKGACTSGKYSGVSPMKSEMAQEIIKRFSKHLTLSTIRALRQSVRLKRRYPLLPVRRGFFLFHHLIPNCLSVS